MDSFYFDSQTSALTAKDILNKNGISAYINKNTNKGCNCALKLKVNERSYTRAYNILVFNHINFNLGE